MSAAPFFERGLNSSPSCFKGSHSDCIMRFCSCACHKAVGPVADEGEGKPNETCDKCGRKIVLVTGHTDYYRHIWSDSRDCHDAEFAETERIGCFNKAQPVRLSTSPRQHQLPLKHWQSTCDTTLSGHQVIARDGEAPYAYTCAGVAQEICDAVNAFKSAPRQPQPDGEGWPQGWCSSCDRMTSIGCVISQRPACDKCGDWLLFSGVHMPESKAPRQPESQPLRDALELVFKNFACPDDDHANLAERTVAAFLRAKASNKPMRFSFTYDTAGTDISFECCIPSVVAPIEEGGDK